MDDRILFVSIAFPPKGDPESIQTGRYVRYLQRTGLKIDVVTSAIPTLFMPYDPSLEEYAVVKNEKIIIPIFENKYLNFLIRKSAPWLLERPDSKFTFHRQWRKVVRSLTVHPEVIYSRSFPLSSAIMGLHLSSYYNVPWFLHLSDPWTESALHRLSSRSSHYHKSMERACFERAARISFTSEKTVELYSKKYPEYQEKIVCFPNVFDPCMKVVEDGLRSKKNNKFRIVYTGGLANTRTARSFLEAIVLLNSRNSDFGHDIEVVFAGDMDTHNRSLFTKSYNGIVKHTGIVNSSEAFALQQSADVLLVIDSEIRDREKAVFFPSKLLDYAVLQKHILAITDPGSTTDTFVRNHGGVCFGHRDVTGVAAWIEKQVTKFKSQAGYTAMTYQLNEYYSAEFQARRLADMLAQLKRK